MSKMVAQVRMRGDKSRPLEAPGMHNRKARRAAKARQVDLPLEPAFDEEKFRASYERRRAEREARPFDAAAQVEYDIAEGFADTWPEWIPIAETLEVALEAAPRFAKLSAAEFTAKGVELADVLAFDGGEHLTCDTGKLTKREAEQKREHVRCLGEALALGACVPGGIKFCGIWLEMVGDECTSRILMPREAVDASA